MIDVNDNAPLFDKPLYEFILSGHMRNFTSPAFVRATDADAEGPNNVIRYEIVDGNYQDKFRVDKLTGEFQMPVIQRKCLLITNQKTILIN